MSADSPAASPPPPSATVPSSPMRIAMFRNLWLATLFSNVGTWMHEVAAGWLMTDLSDSKLLIALVQGVEMGTLFLLGLPAGALADIVDRRKLLMFAQVWNFVAAGAMAVLALTGHATPGLLLLLISLLSIGTALHMPAFQAVVPELVPRKMIRPAVTLNGVAMNLARAVGPALAGVIIAAWGVWAAFAINAVTFLAILFVVKAWKRERRPARLPPEHIVSAVILGLRYARHDRPLQTVLVRTAIFVSCASASWALLPVVVRDEFGRGAGDYGLALGSIGLGAVAGAFVLPRLGRRFSADVMAGAATLVYAAAMVVIGDLPSFYPILPVLFMLGLAWLTIMATLNSSAQTVLPDWVRARGLAVYLIVFSGSMAGGAVVWGLVADLTSVPTALSAAGFVAAAGCLLVPLLRLKTGESIDLAPTKHMPAHPDPNREDSDTGPVQVLVRYRIDEADRARFIERMDAVRRSRLRTGAHTWTLYRDLDDPSVWVESFSVRSWHEHLRQHMRTTQEDWATRAPVRELHRDPGDPHVTHLVVPNPNGSVPTGAVYIPVPPAQTQAT